MLIFDEADQSDDFGLRQRMEQDHMEGAISVSFRRNPSYFYGTGVQGNKAQVIKCVDTDSGDIVGIANRIMTMCYINGEKQRTGYLADLRAHPDYRSGTGLARGYRFLKGLHDKDPVPFYYSMILEDNQLARNALTSSRCGLPCYRDIGRFLTPLVMLGFPKKQLNMPGITIRRANEGDLIAIFNFIETEAANKQFSPVVTREDYNTSRLRDLRAEDFYIATDDREIVGVVACWDQSKFRQTHVESYSAGMRLIKPLYNLLCHAMPLKPFPASGESVPYFYLAFITIKNNSPDIFSLLLRYLYNDRRTGRWAYFIPGLHERDPLAKALIEYRKIDIAGRLYIVHYPEDELHYRQLDERVPYVEISMI